MKWTQEELNRLYFKLQKQAVTDEEFRKELLDDPNGVIERETGEKLPEGFKIQVIESDPSYSSTFVLPDLVGDFFHYYSLRLCGCNQRGRLSC